MGTKSGRVTVYQSQQQQAEGQEGDGTSNEEQNWVQLGNAIYGRSAYDFTGWSVSLSADGATLAVNSSQDSQVRLGWHPPYS